MQNFIVTKDVLEMYDKYEGDFGLLDERWASEKDRQKLTREQIQLFSEYEDKLHFMNCAAYSSQFKEGVLKRLVELEKVIDPAVIESLKSRLSKD